MASLRALTFTRCLWIERSGSVSLLSLFSKVWLNVACLPPPPWSSLHLRLIHPSFAFSCDACHVLLSVTPCRSAPRCVGMCCGVMWCAVLCCAVLHRAVLCCAVLHRAVLHREGKYKLTASHPKWKVTPLQSPEVSRLEWLDGSMLVLKD